MSKKDEYTTIKYEWNDEVENFCLLDGKDFIYPLEPLLLSKMDLDRMDLAESLQSIHYRRTGQIDYSIGLSKKRDIETAKKMGCWD